MNPTLRRLIAAGIALLCGAWMLVSASAAIAYTVVGRFADPVESVFVFIAGLLVGGIGIIVGCHGFQLLGPPRPPAGPRGFEVLPPHR